jgi:hypothetical protein
MHLAAHSNANGRFIESMNRKQLPTSVEKRRSNSGKIGARLKRGLKFMAKVFGREAGEDSGSGEAL